MKRELGFFTSRLDFTIITFYITFLNAVTIYAFTTPFLPGILEKEAIISNLLNQPKCLGIYKASKVGIDSPVCYITKKCANKDEKLDTLDVLLPNQKSLTLPLCLSKTFSWICTDDCFSEEDVELINKKYSCDAKSEVFNLHNFRSMDFTSTTCIPFIKEVMKACPPTYEARSLNNKKFCIKSKSNGTTSKPIQKTSE